MTASRSEPIAAGGAGGEEAARARHPTRPRRPDLSRIRDRFADRLASEGHPWPDLSAAVLAERGRAGLDRESFARTLGVTEETLARVEDGASPVADEGGAAAGFARGLVRYAHRIAHKPMSGPTAP